MSNLIQRNDPVGLDSVLKTVQSRLFNYLTCDCVGWTEYNCYDRGYINPNRDDKNLLQPEHYVKYDQYKGAYHNNKASVESYFIEFDDATVKRGQYTQKVALIFQGNLSRLYPDIEHRADEEFQRDIHFALNKSKVRAGLIGVIKTIDRIYSGLDTTKIKLTNMHPMIARRFDLIVEYNYKCIC